MSTFSGAVDSSNPLVIGTFTATYTGEGDASYGTSDVNANPAYSAIFQDGVTPPNLMPPTGFTAAQVQVKSDRVIVTPTPAGMALLGLGGLVAGRRRR